MKKIIYILFTAIIIWTAYTDPYLMINPGELYQGHTQIKKDCFSCHDPVKGISNEKCISCHQLSAIGKKDRPRENKINILFHESLAGQNCTSCHTDHTGLYPLISISRFSHELVNENIINNCINCHIIPADNMHDKFKNECKGCHTTKKWNDKLNFKHELISEPELTKCISCHKAPDDELHASLTGSCNSCHSTGKWKPSTFDHSAKFTLDEDHNASCITCHPNNNFKKYSCYGCHEHSPGKIASEHNEEGIADFENCVSCHKSGNEHDIKNGFKKEGNHKKDNSKDKDDFEDEDED